MALTYRELASALNKLQGFVDISEDDRKDIELALSILECEKNASRQTFRQYEKYFKDVNIILNAHIKVVSQNKINFVPLSPKQRMAFENFLALIESKCDITKKQRSNAADNLLKQ